MTEESGDSSHFPGHVLIVEDEQFIRNAFKLYLETHGFKVTCAAGGEEALEIFRDETSLIDVILLDLVLPGYQGLELLRQFKAERSLVEVIIATGCGSMNSAIEALRLGAFDYVTKPIVDFDRDLLAVVQKAITHRERRLDQVSLVKDRADIDALRESVQFYGNLESLAASLLDSTTRESALDIIESFLEQHFASVGGVVSEHSADSMSFCHGWGIASDWIEEEFAPPDASEVDFWRPILRSTAQWEQISPKVLGSGALRSEAANEEPLEILRIPLDGAPEAGGQSRSLFIFRTRDEDAQPRPAGTALLALIVNTALSRTMVSLSV